MAAADSNTEASVASEWLQCVCCGGEETTQKLLMCFHPCCDQCLQVTGTDTLACPRCSTVTILVGSPLETNFLKDIQQQTHSLIEPKICIICKPSGKSTIGTHMCIDCEGAHFCQECVKMHSYVPALRSHQPIALSELDPFQAKEAAKSLQPIPTCPSHHKDTQPQPLKWYCKPCHKTICEICWDEDHQTSRHQVTKLTQLSQEKCEGLGNNRSKLAEHIESLEASIMESAKTLEKNGEMEEGLRNEVQNRAESLKQRIDTTCQFYLRKVANFYRCQNDKLLQQNKEKNKMVQKLKSCLGFIENFQTTCSEGFVIKYHEFVDRGIQRIHSEVEATPLGVSIGSIILETPAVKVTSLEVEDYLGQLCRPDPLVQAVQNDQLKVNKTWSITIGTLDEISGIDFSSSGDILLVGKPNTDNNCIHVYGTGGDIKVSIKLPNKSYHDISVRNGDIYVSDRFGSIICLDAEGEVKWRHKIPDVNDKSVALAVGEARVMYVTTGGSNAVLKYNSAVSSFEKLVSGEGILDLPFYLCLTPRGHIAVSNFSSHKVNVFDQQGKLQFHYGAQGEGKNELSYPQGVCCNSEGHIYIADRNNHRISVITSSGEFITNVLTRDHGIKVPRCVCLNSQETLLAVGHSKNQLTVFRIEM